MFSKFFANRRKEAAIAKTLAKLEAASSSRVARHDEDELMMAYRKRQVRKDRDALFNGCYDDLDEASDTL